MALSGAWGRRRHAVLREGDPEDDMSERLTYRGDVREWIAALWIEFSVYGPDRTVGHQHYAVRYLTTYLRLP